MPSRFSFLLALIAGASLVSFARTAEPDQRGIEFFEQKIRPVFVEHCYTCHSSEAAKKKKLRGGLRLDTREAMRNGGDSGPAIVPGDAKKSLLLASVRHEPSAEKMPPKGKLPDAVVADLVRWVEMGAPAPEDRFAGTASKGDIDWATARQHWAYQQPVLHAAPSVKDPTWAKTAIDLFVLAELEKRGLKPVRPASKRELIRRVTLDLLGLPPTPEEIADFERDTSPNAFARVVDRLLASPHYGERWGRYWLDVARYADDKALAFPTPWPHAFRYRDWVVRAFNADMPYDQFLRLQLAGDLIPDATGDEVLQLAGLGFQGLGAEYHKGSVPAQVKADELDDRIDTLTRGLLGLTAACARCHDHKFDPIPTRDYYSLAAAYNGASWTVMTVSPPAEVARYKAWEKDVKDVEARIAKQAEQHKDKIVKPELEVVGKYLLAAWRLRVLNKAGMGTQNTADLARKEKLNAYFLGRCVSLLNGPKKGQPALLAEWLKIAEETQPERGEVEPPRKLQEATAQLQRAVSAALAEKGPKLTPQSDALLKNLCLANSGPFFIPPGDLPGLLGPEARKEFDVLQAELRRVKQLSPPAPLQAHGVSGGGMAMRIAVRGNVERLGELAPPGFLRILERDPAPSRTKFTRLELAEAICSSSNPLTARVIVNRVWQHHFGRGIVATASNFGSLGVPPTHPELLDTLAVRFMHDGWSIKKLHRELLLSAAYQLSSDSDTHNATSDPDNAYLWRFTPRRLDVEAWRDAILAVSGRLDRTLGGPPENLGEGGNIRRTIYGKVSRLEPDKMLVAFDFPDANVSSERRAVTVVPQQQLFVLNSDFMIASARSLAGRLVKAEVNDEGRIALAHQWAFGRAPRPDEVQLALKFLRAPTASADDRLTLWEQYAQAILASNEFVWID